MTKRYMKRAQHHQSPETQIRATVRYHLAPITWLLQKRQITSVGENVEKPEPFALLVGMQLLWKRGKFLKKLKIELPCYLPISLLAMLPKNWNQDPRERSAPPCSPQHDSRQPRWGRHPHVRMSIVVYTFNETSAVKEQEILPFATTWTDLENIVLS